MKQNTEQKARGFETSSGLATGIDGLEDSIGKHKSKGEDKDNAGLAGGAL